MSWVNFISGGFAILLGYAMFSEREEEETEMEADVVTAVNRFAVNSATGRYVTLSCQTCRKLKRHLEIQQNLYECSKCKRLVDLRKH